ncbi:hypothetical protein PDK26_05285 [Bacillus cereus]|nr:hypothetical protein [Bacillus cereus]
MSGNLYGPLYVTADGFVPQGEFSLASGAMLPKIIILKSEQEVVIDVYWEVKPRGASVILVSKTQYQASGLEVIFKNISSDDVKLEIWAKTKTLWGMVYIDKPEGN